MRKLIISEDYGYRLWEADLTDEEFEELKRRWCTIRGLSCLVPVTVIIPQAKEIMDEEKRPGLGYKINCLLHDWDDSILCDVIYDIPKDEDFWMDGRKYTREEVYALFEATRKSIPS
jgi:hypothetical protein